MIDSFDGEHSFCSNFYETPIKFEGVVYPSVENAYQAAKKPPNDRIPFRTCTAGQAKRFGNKGSLRPHWNSVRVQVMRDLIKQKFEDPILKKLLKETEPHKLVEGNHWGDHFWGVCDGTGQNHLGKILMEIRTKIVLD